MKNFQPCVYILASGKRGYMYIGVTSDLAQRFSQHRLRMIEGYSKQRNTNRLVRFELFGTMELAILREKQLKNWHRDWKVNLIESDNSDWLDLAPELGLV
ncbi:MAG: GIY-YIG nuclease family protein [Sphingomonadaceae bacterium]|jgi:putative endonuclease